MVARGARRNGDGDRVGSYRETAVCPQVYIEDMPVPFSAVFHPLVVGCTLWELWSLVGLLSSVAPAMSNEAVLRGPQPQWAWLRTFFCRSARPGLPKVPQFQSPASSLGKRGSGTLGKVGSFPLVVGGNKEQELVLEISQLGRT